jgi:hypothetical protein
MEIVKVEVDYRDAWNNPHTTTLCICATYGQIKRFEYYPTPRQQQHELSAYPFQYLMMNPPTTINAPPT